MTFQLPGYEIGALLGFGAIGEVWLAREAATGDEVAVKRLRSGGDAADRERLRREAATLGAIDHPHLLRLRAVLSSPEDIALVLDYAGGGSLAALLAGRGALAPGEVVTVATPIAEALTAVHRCSVVHGDVSAGNVLFSADGRPLLADLGVARLAGEGRPDVDGTPGFLDPAVRPGEAPTAASDVYALAALCVAALSGQVGPPAGRGRFAIEDAGAVPEPLRVLLARALDPDPGLRPTAAEFAAALFDAATALPVRLADPSWAQRGAAVLAETPVTRRVLRPAAGVSSGSPGVGSATETAAGTIGSERRGKATKRGRRARPLPRRRLDRARVHRALLPALLAVGLLAAATGTGLAWAHAAAPRAGSIPTSPVAGSSMSATAVLTPSPATPTSAPDVTKPQPMPVSANPSWSRVLGDLDDARSAAFAAGRRADLDRVYAAGAPAGVRDAAALDRLVSDGLRARLVRLHAVGVTPVRVSAQRVVLRVRDTLAGYDVVDAAGAVLARHSGRGAALWTITLARTSLGWRIWEVLRV